MLDQLFGSKTRVDLLRLFIDNPERSYYVRELTREIDAQINSVRRELDNLVKLDIVEVVDEPVLATPATEEVPKGLNRKKYYRVNVGFVLHQELSSLFTKSHLMVEKELMAALRQVGNVHLIVMTGKFTEALDVQTDLLIVGDVKKGDLVKVVSEFEKKLGKEINYTVMPVREFEYRRDITDKFLYDILVAPKITVLDTIGLNTPPQQKPL